MTGKMEEEYTDLGNPQTVHITENKEACSEERIRGVVVRRLVGV